MSLPVSNAPRLRRSVLYLPASNSRALEKARSLPADGLTFDLEDAVAPDAKELARAQAVEAVASGAYGYREVTVRINGLDSPWWQADIAALAEVGPDAIVVPKLTSAEDVRTIEAALEAAGAPDRTKIWGVLETASGVLRAEQICAASERLVVVSMGANDLVNELRCARLPGRGPLRTALQLCILGARSAGKTILDAPFNDVRDDAGFLAECRQAKDMGFDGKTVIHPTQIEPANRTWAPSPEDVEEAQEMIEAYAAAVAEGKGVANFRGRMIENLHVDEARRVLAAQSAIEGHQG